MGYGWVKLSPQKRQSCRLSRKRGALAVWAAIFWLAFFPFALPALMEAAPAQEGGMGLTSEWARTFTMPPDVGELEIINQIGTIRVAAAAPGVEHVSILARLEANMGGGEPRINAAQSSRQRVKVKVTGRGRVDFDVRVPASTRLDLLTFRGTISVVDLDGQVRARIASVGDIELSRLRSQQVEGHSHNGTVRFSGALHSKGNYSLKSYSGRVEVAVPDDADFKLLASTHQGGFDLGGFPMRYDRQERDVVEAVSGNGHSKLYLWTQEGRIRLRRQL
jgi:hypothetical protein